MEHQDWKPVVWSKVPKREFKNSQTKLSQVDSESLRIRKIEDENEDFKHNKVGISTGKIIQQARMNLKLKQKDLANRLNVKPNIIQSWESGKAFIDNKLRTKLQQVLKVKLPKK